MARASNLIMLTNRERRPGSVELGSCCCGLVRVCTVCGMCMYGIYDIQYVRYGMYARLSPHITRPMPRLSAVMVADGRWPAQVPFWWGHMSHSICAVGALLPDQEPPRASKHRPNSAMRLGLGPGAAKACAVSFQRVSLPIPIGRSIY